MVSGIICILLETPKPCSNVNDYASYNTAIHETEMLVDSFFRFIANRLRLLFLSRQTHGNALSVFCCLLLSKRINPTTRKQAAAYLKAVCMQCNKVRMTLKFHTGLRKVLFLRRSFGCLTAKNLQHILQRHDLGHDCSCPAFSGSGSVEGHDAPAGPKPQCSLWGPQRRPDPDMARRLGRGSQTPLLLPPVANIQGSVHVNSKPGTQSPLRF